MNPERWTTVERLFHRALELESAERRAFLAEECVDDVDLRREVDRLLAADEHPHELVARLDGGALLPVVDPMVGREIGAYSLTARIASGGMGVVYRAERRDGLFQHAVAIKLIRIELATESLVRRFESERRTLAALHHPNIAALTDGGTTTDGRPYLVMELVLGVPIDRYCDEKNASIVERLRLFVQVCRAVHFAHQNLVVHRDLKPGNILIDATGNPKLLDFGIARVLDGGLQASGLSATMTLSQALTPDYASPEQLTLGPVTTAMDVYSLGVVLYESLTGRRPFSSENQSPIDWQRAVIERPPTRPSTTALRPDAALAIAALAPREAPKVLASRRGMTPKALRRRLRGDLDRIVLMALRKEPIRRYASANDLADDVERHLAGHPVQARGDSFAYRSSKFIRRNRIAVGSAVALVLALAFGVIAKTRGESRALEQAMHARVEAQSFQAIAAFLMDAFLTSSASMDEVQRESQRRRILLHADRVRREYADQDHLRANLLDSLGKVAERLGLGDGAEALASEAADIRLRTFGADDLEYSLSLRTLGNLRYARGELALAAEHFARALEIHRAHGTETHTDIASMANDLAACLRGLGRLDEAEALHLEALALRKAGDPASLAVSESLNNLAAIQLDRGDLTASVGRLEESLAIRRRILGVEDPLTLQSMSNLATTLWRAGRRERAHELLEEVEHGYRALQVDGEEELAYILSNRAGMLIAEKAYTAAESKLDEALLLQMRRLGEMHPSVATTLARRAEILEALGRSAEARESWERVLAIRREPGSSPRYLAQALYGYGVFLWTVKARDEALPAFREAVEVMRSSGTSRGSPLALAELMLGEALLASGDTDSARAHLDGAITLIERDPAGQDDVLARIRASRKRCDSPSDG